MSCLNITGRPIRCSVSFILALMAALRILESQIRAYGCLLHSFYAISILGRCRCDEYLVNGFNRAQLCHRTLNFGQLRLDLQVYAVPGIEIAVGDLQIALDAQQHIKNNFRCRLFLNLLAYFFRNVELTCL